MPVKESENATFHSAFVTPPGMLVQVVPPFVVRRISPSYPTTMPVMGLVNVTPFRVLVLPLDPITHVVPPSVVLMMVLPHPKPRNGSQTRPTEDGFK
jgi:hypothetical protein